MLKNIKTMKTSTRMRHKYLNRPRKPFQTSTTKTILRLAKTWKFITLYIIVLVTLAMFAFSSRNNPQVLTASSGSSSTSPVRSRPASSPSTATFSTSSMMMTSSSATSAADDNWKLGLYTNRTLGRDYDPLLVVYTNNVDALKTSVNYSSRLLKSTADEQLIFNSCSGTTLRHHCQVKSSRVLQDLAFMAHMSMNWAARQSTGVQSLSPQVQQLIALAVYGDADTDFWESLGFLDILLSDVYDIVPDKNR